MRIHTNVSSLKAQRAVGEHTKDIEDSSGKLSSGLRVRTAADDAASLAIGTNLTGKNRSMRQAQRNANDAISEMQVVEGAMSELSNLLSRMRELSVNAATDTLGDPERAMLNYEYMSLRNEFERIAQSTQFNGRAIMSVKELTGYREFQIGIGNDTHSKIQVTPGQLTVNEFKMKLVDSRIDNKIDAQLNLGYIDEAMQKLSGQRAFLGGVQNRLHMTVEASEAGVHSIDQAKSRIMDADFAHESAQRIRSTQLLQGAAGVLTQANQLGANALKLIKENS